MRNEILKITDINEYKDLNCKRCKYYNNIAEIYCEVRKSIMGDLRCYNFELDEENRDE